MCWVMPPASPAATSVSRIASSSEVLPWSTWPMIVTTGGRSASSSSESSKAGSSGSSSAALTISILRSYSSAIAAIDSSVRVWVSVAISPIIISFLITSELPRPSSSATSRTVAPAGTLVASGSAASTLGGGSSSIGRRRRPPRRRGGRCGGGPPIWSLRAACESITTRRFLPLAAAPPPPAGLPAGRTGPLEAAGLGAGFAAGCWVAAGFAGTSFAGAAGAGFFSAGAAAAPPFPFAAWIAFSASASSTLEAAAFASMPALFSAARTSLLSRPCAFAISCTRFFATTLALPPRPQRRSLAPQAPSASASRLERHRPEPARRRLLSASSGWGSTPEAQTRVRGGAAAGTPRSSALGTHGVLCRRTGPRRSCGLGRLLGNSSTNSDSALATISSTCP